jgi:hypothetical protein
MSPFKSFRKDPDDWDDLEFIQFVPVNADEIEMLQTHLGRPLPDQLVAFWTEVGQGVAAASVDGQRTTEAANWVIAPDIICEMLTEPDIVPHVVRDDVTAMPFFEADPNRYLAVLVDGQNRGTIVTLQDRDVLSSSVADFFRLLAIDPDFYRNILGHFSIPNREDNRTFVDGDLCV